MMFHVILLLVLVVFLFHNYFCYIVMFTVVKPINHSENGSTRKHAIGKTRVGNMGLGNIGHLSKTFPLKPLCNIFKVSMSYNIVKLRRMHMKRQSFDNCYIQEPVYWLVLICDGRSGVYRTVKQIHSSV